MNKEKLIHNLNIYINSLNPFSSDDVREVLKEFLSDLKEFLEQKEDENALKATPQTKEGEWIPKAFSYDWYYPTCSVCGYENKGELNNYCPECGSRNLREKTHEEQGSNTSDVSKLKEKILKGLDDNVCIGIDCDVCPLQVGIMCKLRSYIHNMS